MEDPQKDKVPLFKSWTIWYILVILFLLFLVMIFYYITKFFE